MSEPGDPAELCARRAEVAAGKAKLYAQLANAHVRRAERLNANTRVWCTAAIVLQLIFILIAVVDIAHTVITGRPW